ncbi:hypothetical protein ACFSKL_09480 [Belliella marina]|uniref:Uncharacterized protein n=1 Tax=Belliella marina TaxID=1644146 RepID=A0ABW4VNB2_9BACT
MKNYLKTSKWLRWTTAGVFGVMLVLNIMVSIEFEKDKVLPSITLIELGNMAYASGEEGTGTCSSELPCSNGGTASCSGKKTCRVYSWYVECDGVTSYC